VAVCSVVGNSLIFRASPHGVVASHDWQSPIALEVDRVDHADQRGWTVLAVGPGAPVEAPEELDSNETLKRCRRSS